MTDLKVGDRAWVEGVVAQSSRPERLGMVIVDTYYLFPLEAVSGAAPAPAVKDKQHDHLNSIAKLRGLIKPGVLDAVDELAVARAHLRLVADMLEKLEEHGGVDVLGVRLNAGALAYDIRLLLGDCDAG